MSSSAPVIPTARRSANTLESGEIFHTVGGGRSAFSGFGYAGGDLAGAREVLRGKNAAQVRDQRLLGSGRKAPSAADLQSFELGRKERLIGQRPEDQLGYSGPQARGQGAGATM